MALSADNSSLVSCARTREHGLPSDHGRAPVWRRRPLPTVAVTHFLALVDRSVALDGTVPEYWFPGQSRGNSSRDNH